MLINGKERFQQVYDDYYTLINRTTWLDIDTKDAISYRVETLKNLVENGNPTYAQGIKDLVATINDIEMMSRTMQDISKRLYYV